tara:strand:- start:3046 stop:3399 length:354 start_codon:yes stop_codon:yes gene_type:complete
MRDSPLNDESQSNREGYKTMNTFTTELTDVVATAAPGAQTTTEQPLRESVRHALDNYFAQLGGQQPSNLYDMVLEQIELPLLQKVMAFTGNNQSRAAKILGLSRGTLRKKLKVYDLL